MAAETHILDGLNLADGGLFELADTPVWTPAAVRRDWAGGIDSDGSIPVDAGHSDNATLMLPLRVVKQVTADLAWSKVGLLVSKLEACGRQGGTAHLWTPKDMTSTWEWVVRAGDILEFPMSDHDAMMGYLRRFPRMTVLLTGDPFLRKQGELIGDIADDFSTNTIANYTVDAGSGTLSITGGQLVPSSTSEKQLVRSSGYAPADSWTTVKVTTGASVVGGSLVGPIAKRLGAGDFLTACMYCEGGSSLLLLYRYDANVATYLGGVSFAPTAATAYWVRLRVEGNLLTAELFTAAPTATSAPLNTVSYTLAGAEATKFGAGVQGRNGILLWPIATDWRVDDLLIEPNTVQSTEPIVSTTLASVPGHVDAEATVTVTDVAGQPRRHVEGGLGENSTAPLLVDSAAMVVTNMAGTATTRTGAYSSSGVIRATLATQTQAVCGTGNLGHVGALRVKARVWATSLDVRLRLAYRTGDGAYSYTPWITPTVEDDFCEVEFGTITIREVTAGAQQWDGRVEAYTATIGDTLDVDYFEPLPMGRGWTVRTPYVYQAGVLNAYDSFTATTAAAALGTRTAPLGGNWASAGAATDFVFADAPIATDETLSRVNSAAETTGRLAVLGSTAYAATEVGVTLYRTDVVNDILTHGLLFRHVDAANYARLYIAAGNDGSETLGIDVSVAGVVTTLAFVHRIPAAPAVWRKLRIVCFASGRCVGQLLDANGAVTRELTALSAVLATGGALDDGKPGIVDIPGVNPGAPLRYYDNFYAATPPPEPIAIHSGRSMQIRHDSCERESSDGLTWATLSPRGGRVMVPCAGDDNRVTRLWVKARRNDVETMADSSIADSTKLKVTLRPRYRTPTSS